MFYVVLQVFVSFDGMERNANSSELCGGGKTGFLILCALQDPLCVDCSFRVSNSTLQVKLRY